MCHDAAFWTTLKYSYFMAMQGEVKLLSWGSGGDLGNLAEAKGNSFPDLLHYQGTRVWLFPKWSRNNSFIIQLFLITETLSTVRLCSLMTSEFDVSGRHFSALSLNAFF